MGITPMTSLIPLQVARTIQPDLDPLPMERVENSARTGDETYSPSGGKSARGSEDDAREDDLEEGDSAPPDEFGADPIASTVPSAARPISFFA